MTKGKVSVSVAFHGRTAGLGLPYVQLVLDAAPRFGTRRMTFSEASSVTEQLNRTGDWEVVRTGLGPREERR